MKKNPIEDALCGGNPRSLGRAEEIVRLVLKKPRLIEQLFNCLFSDDETVRMRGSDALEKICRQRCDLLMPFTERLLAEVAGIEQPSVQWHLAQILATLPLQSRNRRRAIAILKGNLFRYDDWIVVNLTLESLAVFARNSLSLKKKLIELLPAYMQDWRKSVAKRAKRILAELVDS